MSYYKES